ncbi:nitrate reductase molybdenum cofactor assembly chaperone [Microbacterium sp. Clip185]|uniref:nitrate reductase molybdenum cofactor assembly chaperone n=1 Tax=Microbacterium sp. Clip185 TaxID=3025663 RepID=UPI002366B920|nr:nitrate reductase molybdenum cofactor assembly chaperone [Microbacterium sp. Clip185]WDG17360.1 nitrate reductase molybdenum cofactor assembly chaperone [Microbacterium sp. Clip185]
MSGRRAAARVTPLRALPEELPSLRLEPDVRARAHMIASLLLDYPDEPWFERLPALRHHAAALPVPLADPLAQFLTAAADAGATEWQRRYVTTFDLKRKCSLYLSYYATGDTRRRGVALVTFLEAYRAAGWEFDADDLPDYLPAVLEFSARSGSDIADALIASHREGIEVLRAALESMDSPWALVVRTITLSLPAIDDRTRERFQELVNEGPPTETVGLSFLGNLPAFTPVSQSGALS